MWKYRQNERFINFFPEVNIGHHVESVPFMLLLHKQFEFHLKVRCTAWQEAWNSISSHCVTSRDKLMWHYSRWLCKNVITRKLWVFVFFRICFCLSMCKIIFFSCFVVISNVFTRFINDSLSHDWRTEPEITWKVDISKDLILCTLLHIFTDLSWKYQTEKSNK